MGGGCPPFILSTQVSSFTWFYCGQNCKNLSSTSARLLSASCPRFLGKTRHFQLAFGLPCTTIPSARASPAPSRGRLVRAMSKSIHRRLVQVAHGESPQLHAANGGAVAVIFNRRKWEMLLWEKIIIPRLCQNWIEGFSKEHKQDLGNLVWINFLTLQPSQSLMEDTSKKNLQHFL